MPCKDKQGRECGFLDIDEDDKRKKFRRRYFVLNKQRGLFEWYTDNPVNLPNEAQPSGVIELHFITKVDEAKRMKIDHLFVINTPFRQYYIQASNQRESEEWVEILNDASRIIVPPEAMHPHPQNTVQETSSNGQEEDANAETDSSNCTYRTEIVGNVVVKKKIGDQKKHLAEEPISPPSNSTGSEFSYQLTPDRINLQAGFSNASDSKGVVKKGWAVKQGHVRKNWKRRFFVLKEQGLAYYKSDHDREPIRSIPIGEILAARHEDGDLSKQRDNLFLVATTDKLYYIQTDTPDEMNGWVIAVNDTLRSHRSDSKKKKHQGNHHEETDGRTSERLNERKMSKPTLASVQKQSQSVDLTDAQSEAIAVPAMVPGSSASAGNAQKKHRKTHRRAGSEVTTSAFRALEVVKIPTGNALSSGVKYGAEDAKARPESVNLSALPDQSWIVKSSSTAAANSAKHSQTHPVASRLNSQVDTRSAIKPSAVKKKKNPGVLFSFNAMLSKKKDHIEREKARFSTK